MKAIRFPVGNKSAKIRRLSALYLRLRSRFSLFFFLLVLLPFAILYITAFFHVRGLMEESACKTALTGIMQEKAAVVKYMDKMEQAAETVQNDYRQKVKNAVNADSKNVAVPGFLKAAAIYSLTPEQYRSLSAIYLISGNKITAFYGPNAKKAAMNTPESQQWYRNIVNHPGTVYTLGTVQRFYAEGTSKIVFSMAVALSDSSAGNTPDILLFDFNYSLLTDVLGSNTDLNKLHTEKMIIDSNGNLLYGSNPAKLTTLADSTLQEAIGKSGTGFKNIVYNGSSYYMTFVKYPDLEWTFIDLNPASNVTGHLWLRSPVMTVCIFVLPVLLFSFLAVSIKLLYPINELTTVISDYENQLSGFSMQTPLLYESLPQTGSGGVSDVDLLINKIYSIQLRQKEAELNSLQNQINPHFLYNTLESIRGAALYHGIHDIAAMSKALSLLFRYSISEQVLVTIREELQHLENYMSIQNFRYENKFELQYDVPNELAGYKILKLTLQPLIENSIKHGLEMKLGKGTIKIEILSLNNNLKIQISDDGLGMQPKKVEELNRSLSDKSMPVNDGDHSKTGIGVRNVNSRIKLYFGRQYGLKFMDAPVGTTVEITLPAVREKMGGTAC